MNSIINTGIACYGMSGRIFHAPFIQQNPHFNLSAIVERHKNNSRALYPDSKLYRSFEEMLADDSIELIIVNTPVQTHFDYAQMAIKAGKAVVVEKPFTVYAQEAEYLNRLAKNNNVFLSVYQNRRYDGDFLQIKKILDQGLLGEIKEAEFKFDRYRPEPSGKEHKEANIPGAGVLHDLGAHLIDQALQLFDYPNAVFANLINMRPNIIPNDYFELLMYYPSKLIVRLKASVYVKEITYSYILNGTKGSFLQKRSDLQEEMLDKGAIPSLENWIKTPEEFDGLIHTIINDEEVRKETRSSIGNYMNYYEDVYNALRNNAPNPVPASDAVKTMTIIDAAFQSDKEKRIINL